MKAAGYYPYLCRNAGFSFEEVRGRNSNRHSTSLSLSRDQRPLHTMQHPAQGRAAGFRGDGERWRSGFTIDWATR